MAEKQSTKGIVGFNVVENECIWMKAGVVNFRLCDNAYDCNTCAFDKAMQKAVGSKKEKHKGKESWRASLRTDHGEGPLPCRHALTGRATPTKLCPNNYECRHCAFDQWLDEYDASETALPPAYQLVSGYRIADDYYFHAGHAWARFEHGGRIRIGVDDFFTKLFGPLDTLQLPGLGDVIKQGDSAWTFSRENHQATMRAPVGGTVITVNYRNQNHPDILHQDPYHEGWLLIVEPDIPKKNLKNLYNGAQSIQWMESEIRKLMTLIDPVYDRMAATGAQPLDDIYGTIPELGWERLVENFI